MSYRNNSPRGEAKLHSSRNVDVRDGHNSSHRGRGFAIRMRGHNRDHPSPPRRHMTRQQSNSPPPHPRFTSPSRNFQNNGGSRGRGDYFRGGFNRFRGRHDENGPRNHYRSDSRDRRRQSLSPPHMPQSRFDSGDRTMMRGGGISRRGFGARVWRGGDHREDNRRMDNGRNSGYRDMRHPIDNREDMRMGGRLMSRNNDAEVGGIRQQQIAMMQNMTKRFIEEAVIKSSMNMHRRPVSSVPSFLPRQRSPRNFSHRSSDTNNGFSFSRHSPPVRSMNMERRRQMDDRGQGYSGPPSKMPRMMDRPMSSSYRGNRDQQGDSRFRPQSYQQRAAHQLVHNASRGFRGGGMRGGRGFHSSSGGSSVFQRFKDNIGKMSPPSGHSTVKRRQASPPSGRDRFSPRKATSPPIKRKRPSVIGTPVKFD